MLQSSSSSSSLTDGDTMVSEKSASLSECSCDLCRNQHRRCDRKLPTCSYCEKKGISCYYTDIQKKKNRPSSMGNNRYKPYLFGSDSFSKLGIIDCYFNIITGGYPLISRGELEEFVLIFDESPNSIDDNLEIAALFFSIKTLCEHQKGYLEQAAKSVEKARNVLSRVFDRYNSFIVGGAYAHLLLYELWLGNSDKCKLYLEILNFFRGKLFNEIETLQPEQKNLKTWIEYFDKMVFVNGGGLENMTIDGILRSLSTSNELLGQKLPNEWNALLQTQITSSNYLKIWTIVEAIFTDANEMEKKIILDKSDNSKSKIEMTNLINRFLLNGMKIYIFSKSDDKELSAEMIERSANTITHLTESPWFPLFPMETMIFLKYAIGVHLQIVKILLQTNNFIRKDMNYHELLKKDVRAYCLMKKKYPALINQCDIIDKAEKLLSEIEKKL